MPTKRAPIVRKLRQMLGEVPPANFAPWKNPNNKMQKIIKSRIKGKLDAAVKAVQETLMKRYMTKMFKDMKGIVDAPSKPPVNG
jgi:hypothetical protein